MVLQLSGSPASARTLAAASRPLIIPSLRTGFFRVFGSAAVVLASGVSEAACGVSAFALASALPACASHADRSGVVLSSCLP